MNTKILLQPHSLADFLGRFFDFCQRRLISGLLKFAQQFHLPLRKAGRGENLDFHQQIAVLLATGIGQALAGKTQQRAALDAFGNFQGQGALQAGTSIL